MIYKSGKEIKEIYLGDRPIDAVYIGGRLVWRSCINFPTEAAALTVLFCDAEAMNAAGLTYSAEIAVGSQVVYAEPYMRIVAPMTDSDVFFSGTAAVPLIVLSDDASAASAALSLTDADISASDVKGIKTSSPGSGIHEGDAVAAEGEVMRPAHVCTPVEKVNITSGSGEVLRPINIGGGIHKSEGINADGALTRSDHVGTSVAKGVVVIGSVSMRETKKTFLAAVYNISSTSGQGNGTMLSEVFTAQQEASGNTVDSQSHDGNIEKQFSAVAEVKGREVDSQLYDGNVENPFAAVTEVFGICSDIELIAVIGRILTLTRFSAESGIGRVTKDCSAAHGICIASMTTEIYTEPTRRDFDSTVITDMDVLSISDIDTMKIKI